MSEFDKYAHAVARLLVSLRTAPDYLRHEHASGNFELCRLRLTLAKAETAELDGLLDAMTATNEERSAGMHIADEPNSGNGGRL